MARAPAVAGAHGGLAQYLAVARHGGHQRLRSGVEPEDRGHTVGANLRKGIKYMDSDSSSFALFVRRGRTILAALAIATLGVGFTACGDENDLSEVNDQIDSVQSEADEAQDNLESELNELDESVDQEDLQNQAEDAQRELDQALEENQP
jgi:hypothetical protein